MSSSHDSRSMVVKTESEIELMHVANQMVAEILTDVRRAIKPGVTTWELNRIAEDHCARKKVRPAFKGYRGFPGSLCVSVNEQVVHGIPSRKVKLRKGDIISIDFGVEYKGYFGDSAITVAVGNITPEKRKLLEVTKRSLELGIEQAVIGNRISDISAAVQNYVESENFSVVKQFVGHGIGTALHEAPEIPNFVQKGSSPRIVEGLVLAIEPMVNIGTYEVRVLKDGWTVITADKKASAHFEHTVAVTKNGPVILSSREKFEN